MANHRVLLVQLVEFALLEEQYSIKVILLDFPELLFKWRKLIPAVFWDMDRSRVIFGIARPLAFFIPNVFRLEKLKAVLLVTLGILLGLFAILRIGEEERLGIRR